MKDNHKNLIAACAAISVFGFAFGISYPLLSLILEDRGVSSGMIGVNAAMGPLGILLFSPIIPALAQRFGARRACFIAVWVTIAVLLCYKWFDSLEAWFVLRLLQGMSISVLFTLSEAWVVKYADSDSRGRVVAIYGSILSASFGTGPLIVGWVGIHGWTPFVVGSIALVAGLIPLSLVREEHNHHAEETKPSGLLDFAPKAPMLLACVAVFAILDAATLSLLPIYGLRNSLDITTSATMLSVMIFGNMLLQFPIGWLADKYPKRLVLAGCAIITSVSLLFLPFSMGSWIMWPLLVIVGAAGYGIYTVALASLGDRFTGVELVNGASSFATMWGAGALVGAITGGWSILLLNSHGLPVYLAITYLLLFAGLLIRRRKLRENRK